MHRSVYNLTLIAGLAFALATACAPTNGGLPTDTPVPASTELPPTAEPAPTAVAPTPSAAPLVGYVLFRFISADAGNYALQAGDTLSFTWDQAPTGASAYEFYFHPEDGSDPMLLGTDHEASDGVMVLWQVPPHLVGYLQAVAYFPDGTTIASNGIYNTLYTGAAPPPNICSLRALTYGPLDLTLEPNATSPTFAALWPGTYAQVLSHTADGWYQVATTDAHPKLPSEGLTTPAVVTIQPMPTGGWVNPELPFRRFGPCEALPLAEN